jgi:tetratricopeptide (TPR) repeat protein
MLQGSRPFDGETQDLIKQIRNRRPPPLGSHVPSGLKRIVYKGLEKKPEDRYQTASDMLCELEVFQYFETQIVRVADEVEQQLAEKYPRQTKVSLRLSEMYTDQSIEALNSYREYELESGEPNPSTSFRLALLHGAANEYDEAEAGIQETQQLDLQNSEHPLKQDHPFIKRFVAAPKKDEQPPPEDTIPDEEEKNYKNQVNIKVNIVEQLISNGQFKEARTAADEILNACTDLEIYLCLCNLFYKEYIFDKVIDLCESAIKLYKNNAELYALLGKATCDTDRNKARESIEKAKELGSDDEELDDLLILLN